ncbi:hypothetical protein D3C87_2027450 [compost metagenome]
MQISVQLRNNMQDQLIDLQLRLHLIHPDEQLFITIVNINQPVRGHRLEQGLQDAVQIPCIC